MCVILQDLRKQIVTISANPTILEKDGRDNSTIFHALLNSIAGECQTGFDRLFQEGQAIVSAGVETTARS